MAERYADASAREHAREVLQILVKRGDATEAERAQLADLEASIEADREAIGETKATARGAVQGVTFSAADEIGSALGAVSSLGGDQSLSDAYSEQLEQTRGRNKAASEAFPDAYSRGQLLGGAAASVVPIGGVLGASKGASTLTQMLLGGLTGGGISAANDFAAGEGGAADGLLAQAANRAENIDPVNLAIGSGTGAAAAPIAKMGGRFLANRRAPVGKPLIAAGVDPQAARIASRSITDDATVQGDLRAYLSRLGDDSMVADAGRNTRTQAGAVVATPGSGATRLVQALDRRNAGTAGRVRSEIDAVGGDVQDQAMLEAIRKRARTSEASPLYDAAKASPAPLDTQAAISKLDAMIADRAPGAASLKKFRKALEDDPRAVVLHNIRSDVDGMARAAWANNPSHAATYRQLVKEIDAQLDAIPGYAKARATWADSKALDDAADAGMKFMDNTDSDRLRIFFGGLSEPEKAAYRSAARRALDLKMSRAMNENTKAANLMGPTETRAKIDIVFGKGSADRLLSREAAEKAFKETRNTVTGNSETAARIAAQKELAPIVDEAGNRLGPIQRARQAVNEPINSLVDDILAKPKGKALDDLASILSASGKDRDSIVGMLLNDGANVAKNKRVAGRTKRVLEALIGAGGSGIAIGRSD